MERIQLSENFWLHEFTASATAQAAGREVIVFPGSPAFYAIGQLCERHLQPLRNVFGPITINSAYRPDWLNELIGGSRNSQHRQALAVDFVVPALTPLKVCEAIQLSGRSFDQVIHEFGRWTHISISLDGQDRNELLTAGHVEGRVVYRPGLISMEDFA